METNSAKVVAAAGHAANATCDTMTSIIWHDEVRSTVARLGGYASDAGRAYMDSQVGRARMNRGWAMGEPVWMAAAMALDFALGAAKAAEDDAHGDDYDCLRRAYRSRTETAGS